MSNKPYLQNISTSMHFHPLHYFFNPITAWVSVLIIIVVYRCTPMPNSTEGWIGTWGTALQLVEPNNMPPKPGLTNNTLRQIVCVSLGGNRLRVRFSNKFGTSPVILDTVHIAVSIGGSAIDSATEKSLLFNGKLKVVIAPGTAVTSDSLEFVLMPRTNVAITIHFDETSPAVTGHPGSRTTSYLLPGNQITSVAFSGAIQTDHWYIISGIDVIAPGSAGAVVVLGNSITDGRGSGTNKQNRWPDQLAIRLQENPGTKQVAVLNMGIGGNCVLRNCLGPAAINRFKHDVLSQNGVRWLIILEGINDIGQAQEADGAAVVADNLIAAYKQMIEGAHAMGIHVYGATLLPFGGSFYVQGYREAARKQVNEWIRNSGCFDTVIDLDAALRDRDNPLHLRPEADSGDHLHPNERGHRMIAETVDLSLFK